MKRSDLLDLLDVAALERWLRRRPPDEECGVRGASEECPLATYLREESGETVYVNPEWVTSTRTAFSSVPTPEPLARFIRLVDAGGERYGPVTARQALAYARAVRS